MGKITTHKFLFLVKTPKYIDMNTNRMPNDQSLKIIDCKDLIDLFNGLFLDTFNTILEGEGEEPEYIPAGVSYPHNRIIFAHNYSASALHEVAHWCIAGTTRRHMRDYGYWYVPDGRNPTQQLEFEQVEIKPQALEWLFSEACGLGFRVSIDNLDGLANNDLCGDAPDPSLLFKQRIVDQAQAYVSFLRGQDSRAGIWIQALSHYYQTPSIFERGRYQLEYLN